MRESQRKHTVIFYEMERIAAGTVDSVAFAQDSETTVSAKIVSLNHSKSGKNPGTGRVLVV